MNKQINNTSSSSTIDLSGFTTYGELKNALPSTGRGRVPGINQLRDKAVCLLSKKTASGTVEIFDNGFYIFMECERETVYGVDRCEWPSTYTEDGKGSKKPLDFSPYPWDLILESAGSARLAHNADSREVYRGEISIDAPESENNIALSVRPEHEIREEEDETAALRRERNRGVAQEYAHLRDDQKELIDLYFVRRMKQEDIAKLLGITQGRVSRRIATIQKRLKKFL